MRGKDNDLTISRHYYKKSEYKKKKGNEFWSLLHSRVTVKEYEKSIYDSEYMDFWVADRLLLWTENDTKAILKSTRKSG